MERKALDNALNAAGKMISLQQRQLAVRDSTIRAYMALDTAYTQSARLWALKEVEYKNEIRRERKGKRMILYAGAVIAIYAIVETFRE